MFLKLVLGFVNLGMGWLAFLFCLFLFTFAGLLYGDYRQRSIVHLNCLRLMLVSLSITASLVLWLRILRWPIDPAVIYLFAVALLISIGSTLYFQARSILGTEWHFKSVRIFRRKS